MSNKASLVHFDPATLPGRISSGYTLPVVKLLSYADELEVFLSKPSEWTVPKEQLSVYGLCFKR
jgi:hypothetical protein